MKKVLATLVAICILFSSIPAFAEHGGRGGHGGGHFIPPQHHGGHHRGGWEHGAAPWLFGALAGAAVTTAVIESSRPRQVVVVNGFEYQYDGTYYYAPVNGTYVRVEAPVVMKIVNSDGTITEISLIKNGYVWIGPRGETYTSFPSHDQLRSIYGR